MFFKVTFRSRDKTIDPRKEFLCTVISVKNYGYSILFSKGSDMERSRDGTSNGCSIVGVVKVLSGIKL